MIFRNLRAQISRPLLRFSLTAGLAIGLCSLTSVPPAVAQQPPATTAADTTSDAGTLDMTQWFPVPNAKDTFQPSPIDQSASLDAPAGRHGFMKNSSGRFVFEDGTPVRLVAVGQSPIVPKDKAQADYIARWLAKWGVNMVRFHALQDVVIDKTRTDTTHLDASAMDLLDYFIDQLARRGIYCRLSMLYYHQLKPGDGVDTGGKETLNSMAVTFFDPKAMAANMAIEKAILTHHNPYRANKMYGEDPAIAQLEVTNEDSVFFYTIDAVPDQYKPEFDSLWNDWLAKRYGSREKIAAAWGSPLPDGPVKRMAIWEFNSAVPPAKQKQASDQVRFYSSLDTGYFNRTRQMMRDAGAKQPVCGTGWTGVGSTFYAQILASDRGMDYVDRHHYWGGGPGDWRIVADPAKDIAYQSALKAPEQMLSLSAERDVDLPFTISEWTNTEPNESRLESAPLMAFYGSSLNGWDAPIQFSHDMGYFNGEEGFTKKLFWMWSVNEASILCQYPALSQVVRRGDIREGKPVYVRSITTEQALGAEPLPDASIHVNLPGAFDGPGAPSHALIAQYAAAVGKTGIRFTDAPAADEAVDLSSYIDLQAKQIKSETGELNWNYGAGFVTANAPRIQAAVGCLNGASLRLTDCEIRSGNTMASVLVTSCDGRPIKTSRHLLITAVGRCRNTGMAYSTDGHRLLAVGESPVLLEGVKGFVILRRAGRCTVSALSPLGYKTADVEPVVRPDSIAIPMNAANHAAYYDVVFQ